MITHFDMTDGHMIEPIDDGTIDTTNPLRSPAGPGRPQPRLLTVTEAMASQHGEAAVHGALLQLSPHRFEKF